MRNRILTLAALTAAPLAAQFSGLVTTGNGAELYFSSQLALGRESGQPQQGRIYRVGSKPVRLVAEVAKVVPSPSCGLLVCATNAYNLFQPDVSRDGEVLAYIGAGDCVSALGTCDRADVHQTTVRMQAGQSTVMFNGQGWLSGTGQYLVYYQLVGLFSRTEFYRVDLRTGDKSFITAVVGTSIQWPGNGRVVADSGDFVFASEGQVNVLRSGRLIAVARPQNNAYAANAVIDGAGDTVLYQSWTCCSPSAVRIFHPDTGDDAVLFAGNGYSYEPVMSADGKRVAFLSTTRFGTAAPPGPSQVYLSDIEGASPLALTADPDGIAGFTLSDDGQTIWYLNRHGAIYQLNTATGQAEEKVPWTLLQRPPAPRR